MFKTLLGGFASAYLHVMGVLLPLGASARKQSELRAPLGCLVLLLALLLCSALENKEVIDNFETISI